MKISHLDFSENDLRDWFFKVLKMRGHIIRLGKNCKGSKALKAFDKIDLWLKSYPNSNFMALTKFFLRHENDLKDVLPGVGSSAYEKLKAEFEAIRIQCMVVELCAEFRISVDYNHVEIDDYNKLLEYRDLAQRYRNEIRITQIEGIRHYYTKKLNILMREFTQDILNLQTKAA